MFREYFSDKKEQFDNYSEWLFKILNQVEKDYASENKVIEPRKMGYLSEWLLNVWVRYNKLQIKYIPVHVIESKKNAKYIVKVMLEQIGYIVQGKGK